MVVMEMCTNGALREALKLHLSWMLKVRIALDMTAGLQFLHEQGIIHRDIKTPNVLVDGAWRAKLCDYNFAIDQSSPIKQEFCAGTEEFMAPEVLLVDDYGTPSDIFSLGIIMVEMLTGIEPSCDFPSRPPQDCFAVDEDEVRAALLQDCPGSLSLLLSQCLFADPGDRPPAEDAHSWLEELLGELGGGDEVPLPTSGPPKPVLTEGAAHAREGNVINASPKGTGHWHDAVEMEQALGNMVEDMVEKALIERDVVGRGRDIVSDAGGVSEEQMLAMEKEIQALKAEALERDSKIAEMELQMLRNSSTLKMLSSALEVAYKMIEGQQALLGPLSHNPPAGFRGGHVHSEVGTMNSSGMQTQPREAGNEPTGRPLSERILASSRVLRRSGPR
ncbi:unnamed protein product [Discosporangium mesarthrocarpum]